MTIFESKAEVIRAQSPFILDLNANFPLTKSFIKIKHLSLRAIKH